MAHVSTYLNFPGTTEAAFTFYKSVFDTEFTALSRYGDFPAMDGQPPLPDEQKNLIMNVQLPTLGGHVLMATDNLRHELTIGNSITISLMTDSREQTDTLFAALSEDGTVTMPLQEMFWGDYYGTLTDKFGMPWMFNCTAK